MRNTKKELAPEFVSQSVLKQAFPVRIPSLLDWCRRQARARNRTIDDLADIWSTLLETGIVPNRAALARLQGVSRARVTQVLGAVRS